MVEELKSIRSMLNRLNQNRLGRTEVGSAQVPTVRWKIKEATRLVLCVKHTVEEAVKQTATEISVRPLVKNVISKRVGPAHFHIEIILDKPITRASQEAILSQARVSLLGPLFS